MRYARIGRSSILFTMSMSGQLIEIDDQDPLTEAVDEPSKNREQGLNNFPKAALLHKITP
jgi:hypothetical protein